MKRSIKVWWIIFAFVFSMFASMLFSALYDVVAPQISIFIYLFAFFSLVFVIVSMINKCKDTRVKKILTILFGSFLLIGVAVSIIGFQRFIF